jgi:hypothetical protein
MNLKTNKKNSLPDVNVIPLGSSIIPPTLITKDESSKSEHEILKEYVRTLLSTLSLDAITNMNASTSSSSFPIKSQQSSNKTSILSNGIVIKENILDSSLSDTLHSKATLNDDKSAFEIEGFRVPLIRTASKSNNNSNYEDERETFVPSTEILPEYQTKKRKEGNPRRTTIKSNVKPSEIKSQVSTIKPIVKSSETSPEGTSLKQIIKPSETNPPSPSIISNANSNTSEPNPQVTTIKLTPPSSKHEPQSKPLKSILKKSNSKPSTSQNQSKKPVFRQDTVKERPLNLRIQQPSRSASTVPAPPLEFDVDSDLDEEVDEEDGLDYLDEDSDTDSDFEPSAGGSLTLFGSLWTLLSALPTSHTFRYLGSSDEDASVTLGSESKPGVEGEDDEAEVDVDPDVHLRRQIFAENVLRR